MDWTSETMLMYAQARRLETEYRSQGQYWLSRAAGNHADAMVAGTAQTPRFVVNNERCDLFWVTDRLGRMMGGAAQEASRRKIADRCSSAWLTAGLRGGMGHASGGARGEPGAIR
jgi:hypothetical protein